MRNNKNNITFNVRNIILNYRILISYFTEKKKIITLSLVILILSSINLINVSALSYSSNVGIGFTFNPTLSISLSSSDLTISSLTPGATSDSNSININIATNAAYGYNLSANVGNSTYNNTSLNNINNSNDSGNASNVSSSVFSSIDTNASLASLTIDNTWGYSYRLTDNNGSSNAWSNYSGLPLYSSNNSKTLIDKYTQSEDTINFKIAARASNTQPSGTYSNVINFIAISYASPMSLSDSYAYFGKELYHGYYKMQDMTTRICQTTEAPSELQVIDIRDDKVYWIAKLADGNCWMTQNLDLDLISNPEAENYIALTSENTDLNDTTNAAYQDGYSIDENEVITWVPENNTIVGTESNGSFTFNGWENDYNNPYSADVGNLYINNTIGNHGLAGNYYNWPAAVASNDAASFANSMVVSNSLCPNNWKLPDKDNFENLTVSYSAPKQAPTYYILTGHIWNGATGGVGGKGYYSTSENQNNSYACKMVIFGWRDNPILSYGYLSRSAGFSVRCLAR